MFYSLRWFSPFKWPEGLAQIIWWVGTKMWNLYLSFPRPKNMLLRIPAEIVYIIIAAPGGIPFVGYHVGMMMGYDEEINYFLTTSKELALSLLPVLFTGLWEIVKMAGVLLFKLAMSVL